MFPAYLALHRSGELAERARRAVERLASCDLCPRLCGADRTAGQVGFCGVGRKAVVAAFNPHFGEEAVLVGERGSGTVFFAGCNLGCVFCQNHDISHEPDAGLPATPAELAGVMLELQKQGCHNINFVTPSHVVPQILEALPIAADHGLRLPLVYNTGAYDTVETLELLDGVIDVYMPDVKVWSRHVAGEFLLAEDYPERARAAVREMFRQVGRLATDSDGVAMRGLLVRHLVLPDDLAGTKDWMRFLSGLSPGVHVNIMGQYRPCGRAGEISGLDRIVTRCEYLRAVEAAKLAKLACLDPDCVDTLEKMGRKLH
ncbi:radical SAM protein [Pseudodesulfovibrio tunisiensis]|uniref:radical SAM protein n=1 Tax=Pseudodesulfovibrio tunisiensis TaxID=463192 RepID=UPI001FB4B867|nr:radical SAM protein [Pseudodesulfovibrio tunisiensis]